MSAREGLPVVDFLSADSSSRGETMGRESSVFQPSPPVSLSLRTRESSALSLKHIFDQIYSSADSKPNHNISTGSNRAHDKRDNAEPHILSRDASNAAFQGARNQVSPSGWQANSIPEEHKMARADMDSSLAKVQPQVIITNNSNIGTTALTPLVQSDNPPFFQTGIPQAVSRPSASSPSLKQPTAQLTVFYAGTVNVYDDVPADRANAIMLLAGTGNPCSMKPACEGEKEQAPVKLSSPSPLPVHVGAPLLTADPMASPVGTTSAMPIPGKTIGFSQPSAPSTAVNTLANTVSMPSTPSSASSMPTESRPQVPPKRPHAGIELPQARKASLARFLEKRKDRVVQVKQQEQEVSPQGEEKGNGEERPSSPKRPCVTGLSFPTFKQ